MKNDTARTEALLRASSVLMLALTACLVGFDHQTKFVFFVNRKASFSDLSVLPVLVYVDAAVAVYNLVRLFGLFPLPSSCVKTNRKGSNIYLAWLSFLLDQIAVYVAFGANSAGFQASLLAVTGLPEFQWMKLCNKYTRFCFQIGGGLACGYLACLLMIFISSISAFNLFRLYLPKNLLILKPIPG